MTWFRHPFAHLVLLACDDYEEYKRTLRPTLRALAEAEPRPVAGAPELVFASVRASTSAEPLSTGAYKAWGGVG